MGAWPQCPHLGVSSPPSTLRCPTCSLALNPTSGAVLGLEPEPSALLLWSREKSLTVVSKRPEYFFL